VVIYACIHISFLYIYIGIHEIRHRVVQDTTFRTRHRLSSSQAVEIYHDIFPSFSDLLGVFICRSYIYPNMRQMVSVCVVLLFGLEMILEVNNGVDAFVIPAQHRRSLSSSSSTLKTSSSSSSRWIPSTQPAKGTTTPTTTRLQSAKEDTTTATLTEMNDLTSEQVRRHRRFFRGL